MDDITTSYSNYKYKCPLINKTVDTEINIVIHTMKSSLRPNEEIRPFIFKYLEYCSCVENCGIKIRKGKRSEYNCNICPLHKKLINKNRNNIQFENF